MGTERDKYGFRFREWNIYKDARIFRGKIRSLWQKFPVEEKYALTDQIKRAANSIILNIAEGSNKTTDKDTRLYITRSLGSLDEVVACLDAALDEEYISTKEHDEGLTEAASLARRLKAFITYLKNSM